MVGEGRGRRVSRFYQKDLGAAHDLRSTEYVLLCIKRSFLHTEYAFVYMIIQGRRGTGLGKSPRYRVLHTACHVFKHVCIGGV